jgi:hypothetical protein
MPAGMLRTADVSDQHSALIINVYQSKIVFRSTVRLKSLAQAIRINFNRNPSSYFKAEENDLPVFNSHAAYRSLKIHQNDKSRKRM